MMDKFKEEIIEVCKKHNMYISHEDSQGGFLIVDGTKEKSTYIDKLVSWFKSADKARD